ncbi:YrdB family protein [Paenarthrobacter sp. PH39-S1]|uniref:YrdB family protein n=1 Tax=Paenarthrobacter sp. PH39-S1 TaxID=3046204 RepID=UPI0024BAE427|nr:YrdB family protein [Paenarthrobacter sp. PH39-S1]MDJ0358102.1 YrdB family protein [Paenarthrobacter sp. PH39-S1]
MSRRRAAFPPQLLTGVHLCLAFLLEVAMVAAFCVWGFKFAAPWNYVLGIGVPAAVVVLWSLFLAPRATHRIPLPVIPPVSLLIFLLAAVALSVAELVAPAIVLAVIGAGNAGLGLYLQSVLKVRS